MIINEPVNSPFKTVNALNYSWIPEFQKEARDNIDSLLESIKYEATEVDHNSLYLDESLLYDMFKYNVDYDEYNANFIILKYLNYYLQIKMLKYVSTGEWLFTDNDIEMLRYFAELRHDCKSTLLSMKHKVTKPSRTIDLDVESLIQHYSNVLDRTDIVKLRSQGNYYNYYIYKYPIYEVEEYTRYQDNSAFIHEFDYYELFDEWFERLDTIITHARTNNDRIVDVDDMFRSISNVPAFRIYSIASEEDKDNRIKNNEYDIYYGSSVVTHCYDKINKDKSWF